MDNTTFVVGLERRWGVEFDWISCGRLKSVAFFGQDVKENGSVEELDLFDVVAKRFEVVAVDRA